MRETTSERGSIEVFVTCTSCGEPLTEEEQDAPRTGDDADVLCDECYHDLNEFDCCWCDASDEDTFQHVLLVVFDAHAAGVALPGVYRIDALPYVSQPLIEHGRLWEDALTWLGSLPACHADGSPCGHLCRRCQRRALDDVLYATRCAVAALP
jgi:hypothetical protein